MKKILVLILMFLVIVVIGYSLPKKSTSNEFLRVHIKANSNIETDENLKYEVRSVVVNYLTPKLNNIKTKNEAMEILQDNTLNIKNIIDNKLKMVGFGYSSNVYIDNEFFPTRNYDTLTLESGYYDAIIIVLGEGRGDNWWCLVYPPLCFTNTEQKNVNFKSKISELWKRFIKE